jgi:hypothetical protein
MTLQNLNRWQAAPIHLAISAIIAAAVFAAMLLLWYPKPYFYAAGGKTLLMLLIGVDVIIGPLLTLIVFDPRKKHLVYDLAVIAMLQVAALVYGAMIMFDARPVYVAFAGDRFELVEANAIDPEEAAKAKPDFRKLPLTGPQVVGTRLPFDPKERERLGFASMFGLSIGVFPQHYVPYTAVSRDAIAGAKPLSRLRAQHADRAADIDSWIAASGRPEASMRYLPLQARHGDMTVVIDAATGELRGVLPIDPW